MSKISSLGQSMAALFSPDAKSRRQAGRADLPASAPHQATAKIQAVLSPTATAASSEANKDGNPASPGYEFWGKKKKAKLEEENSVEFKPKTLETTTNSTTIQVPGGKDLQLIRIQFGWDKLLLAQKKICEKAKNLFTKLEAPELYHTQRGAKAKKGLKYQGCVVDVDIEALRHEQELADKRKKAAG